MRTFARLKLAAAVAVLALGISGAAQAAVTVLGWPGGPEETALRAAAAAYNAKSTTSADDKVNLIFFNRDGFFDKLQADLAAGTDAFDANLLATYALGRYVPYMDPVDLGPDAEKTYGNSLKTMQYDGKQYGVPTDLGLHYMYYRKDLITALLADPAAKAKYEQISQKYLGKTLDPKDPDSWTWDDWAATALYFTKSINPDSPVRYGTVLQMKNLLFNMMVFQSLPRSYGADWMDDKGNVTVDSDAYRTGLKLYKTLYDAGATPKDSLTYEYPETDAAFEAGQVATALQWSGAATELTDPTKSPAIAGKVGIVAPPAGPNGRFVHFHSLGLGINDKAKNKAGAIKFLQWLSTEEGALVYARAGGSPALSADLVAKVAAQRPDLPTVANFANSYGFIMRGGTSKNALSVYELQAKEFTGFWAGTETLDQALSNTKTGMEQLLKQ